MMLPTVLPWLIALIAVLLLIGVVLGGRSPRYRASRGALPANWPLSARPIFRPDERRAYRRLREALPNHVILAKVPLVRFCHPDDPGDVRRWYEMLAEVHVTFCICSASGRVLAAVDLRHRRGESRRTTQIKQAVMTACGIRYIHCTYEELPPIPELQSMVPPLGQARRDGGSGRRRKSSAGERSGLWGDSADLPDSFFGSDSRSDHEATTDFAALRGRDPRDLAAGAPSDIVGVVVDPPKPPPSTP